MAEDYYKTLGVNRNASQADIEKAYRKLATKLHPDLHPDDRTAKEKFQKVQQAYDVLNDPEKREMYDRYGSSFESMGGGPQWQTHRGGGTGPEIDFSQFFGKGGGSGGEMDIEELLRQFGGNRRQTRRQRAAARGADLHYELEIPFNTSINGGQAQLLVRRSSGATESIQVKIPAGISDGKKIRVRGQGEKSASGGTPGDILITIRVARHPFFRRHGDDLEIDVPVTVVEAALGATIDLPTPQGTIALKIPPGTSSGKRLRVKGLGAPMVTGRGDLYAVVQIVLPAPLDATGQELIRKLASHYPQNPRANLQW